MRLAIVHDHLRFIGGGERVVLTLASGLDGDLYVTDLDPGLTSRAGMSPVRTIEVARVPRRPPMRQDAQMRAFGRVTLPPHDVYVLSGNWTVFAAPNHHPNIWYCNTPVRIFYDLRDSFLNSLSPVRRSLARRWIESRRPGYEAAISSVDSIVANSGNVAARIERYLHRKGEVVHPPVDTARYRFERVGKEWLAVSRLSHEKRIGLLVETFRRLPGERLVIAGGPQMGIDPNRFVRSLRPPKNVEFLGEIGEEKLRELYARCRGLVATAEAEDFGMTPVEAMAAGKAVVAVDEGGYRETVVPGETGWLVPATPEALSSTIEAARPSDLERMRIACELRAKRFDRKVFLERMERLVAEAASAS